MKIVCSSGKGISLDENQKGVKLLMLFNDVECSIENQKGTIATEFAQ